ncbi:MAG TPA: NUDIX hydrolase [Candidatus Thermoplasmatota archaeon]|nr:NUDIX hydrolase [Candidatus Thermoplasmatota archaeon]
MAERRVLYIESDGQVYLVKRGGRWTFPDEGAELGFSYTVRHSTRILDVVVSFCRPNLSVFPADWMFKDDVPLRLDVDPLVQRAINASLARCVVGVILTNAKDDVLLVKSSRGFTKGMWNVPGGFIEYGEAPEIAAAREAKEETGLDVEVGEMLGVYTERFESPYFMYGFMYAAKPKRANAKVTPDPTEIEAFQWLPARAAIDATRNPFALQALAKRFSLPLPQAFPRRRLPA